MPEHLCCECIVCVCVHHIEMFVNLRGRMDAGVRQGGVHPPSTAASRRCVCTCAPTVCVWLISTCEQLSDLHVRGLSEQPDQSRDASTVLQGDFVVIIGFAVHQVPQGSAGAAVHVGHPVVQQVHQQLDAALPPDLRTEEGRMTCEGAAGRRSE